MSLLYLKILTILQILASVAGETFEILTNLKILIARNCIAQPKLFQLGKLSSGQQWCRVNLAKLESYSSKNLQSVQCRWFFQWACYIWKSWRSCKSWCVVHERRILTNLKVPVARTWKVCNICGYIILKILKVCVSRITIFLSI